MPDRLNHPSLDDLRAMPIGEIVALPADQLALLQDEAEAALQAAKRFKDWLDGAIALRYAERAQVLRRAESKDTGIVRFQDGDVTVIADLPKKVDWDQGRLAALVEEIRAGGENPLGYVEITYRVPERAFGAWPPAIRDAFATARTVRTGKPAIRLELKESN